MHLAERPAEYLKDGCLVHRFSPFKAIKRTAINPDSIRRRPDAQFFMVPPCP